jgi:hypothetical protein
MTVNINYIFDDLLMFIGVFIGDKVILSRTYLALSEAQPQ